MYIFHDAFHLHLHRRGCVGRAGESKVQSTVISADGRLSSQLVLGLKA